ncbi:unnamed protein product, partial [Brugia timori]|uniref:ATP-dependent endonuclease n=1 Tax=Brugia timori TaxID=42155 RepID=A0A0R3Q5V5_9BILA
MKVVRLAITNFRGIQNAELLFDGHTLFVGSNNVGKSTICEALDLVLSPDRLNRTPPIDEFDFYNARYWTQPPADGEPGSVVPLRIEVVLIQPSAAVMAKCGSHIEFWHTKEHRLIGQGEADLAAAPVSVPCLRLETVGRYDEEEDEFVAKTYFVHSPDAAEGEDRKVVPRPIKREFGFLYLRALRTGSRALSLERGSLLDIILRTKGIRTALWERTIERLRGLDVEADANEIAPVLREIEKRLNRYIALEAPGNATSLHVSELTRDHLRKTMAFFLKLSPDQDQVPFAHAGTGTLNTLVLALLSFIADLKPDNVIFAMEEPEIAVPPPTQRRIAQYLLTKSTQAFVTSHSPFVIERFSPSHTLLLSRNAGTVTAQKISDASGLSEKEFKRFARWGLCECMLGKAAVVVEGLTEFHALPVAAARMEAEEPKLTAGHSLDVLGATFFYADGESNMAKFGKFFKTLKLKTFGFYDYSKRPEKATEALKAAYDVNCEHEYKGFEDLVAREMPVATLWTFLHGLRASEEVNEMGIPEARPDEAAVRKMASVALRQGKGAGWAASLFESCPYDELPPTAMDFLRSVYGALPKPVEIEPDDELGKTTVALRKAVARIGQGLQSGQTVLFLSFSRAAVARVLDAAKMDVSYEHLGLLSVETFHAFFWRLLKPHGYLLGAPRRLSILLPHDEAALRGGIGEEDAQWADWLHAREQLFWEQGRVAFDLFAPKAAELLERCGHLVRLIGAAHPLIIVDEAQDTGTHAWRCVELLAPHAQVLCLADLDQQIYDFLPGVGPERVSEIREALDPFEQDLGSDNGRSPDTEILAFANDILTNRPRGAPYRGVERISYNPKMVNWNQLLRRGIKAIFDAAAASGKEPPKSIAVLADTGRNALGASKALSALGEANKGKAVAHKLHFDE